jgi:uncharacterized protein
LPAARGAPAPIDVYELARTGGVVEGRLPIDAAQRLRQSLRDEAGELAFRLEGRIDALGRPAARLLLRGTLPLTCDRCAQPLAFEVDHQADFYFLKDERALEGLPITVDESEPLPGSTSFDLAGLIEEEAILCIPVSPRHAQCPRPAEQPGKAARSMKPNPFAVLPDLLRPRRK